MTADFISKETLPHAFVPLTFKRGLLQVKGCIWETKMYLRSISALAVITALGACGGSSDGSAVNPVRPPVPVPVPVPVPTVLASFTDGSGVVQSPVLFTDLISPVGCNPACDDFGNILTSDVTAKVNGVFFKGVAITALSESTPDTTLIGLPSYEPDVRPSPEAYTQRLLINGEEVDATLIYDGVMRSYIIKTPGDLIAGGVKVSNIQTANGTYRFLGSNVVKTGNLATPEYGEFTMDVDFTQKTASIQTSIQTSGPATTIATDPARLMTVDNRNGTFSGNSLIITTTDQPPQLGSMQGNFHGDFRSETGPGVSGLYYNNDRSTQSISGAIAGSGGPTP